MEKQMTMQSTWMLLENVKNVAVGTRHQHAPDLEPHRGADCLLRRHHACQL